MDGLNQLYGRLRTFLDGLSPRRRYTLLGIVVASVALSGTLLYAASRPDWTPLTESLEPHRARTLLESLRGEGFDVQVRGDRLYVPAAQVGEAYVAAYGSDQGGTLPGITTQNVVTGEGVGRAYTRPREKLQVQVGREGDLAWALSQMEPVKRASVRLVLPEDSLFPSEQVEARASVDLTLHAGATLSDQQVRAVTNLVAASVPKLRPGAITVADTSGRLYTRPMDDEDDGLAATSRLDEQVRERERALARKATEALGKLYASDQLDVQVTLAVDRAGETTTVSEIGEPVTTRMDTSETETTSGAARESGVPGAGASLPETEARDSLASEGSSTAFRESLENVVPTNTIHRTEPAGAIERMTVAVLVDGERTIDAATGEETWVAADAERIAQIEEHVKRAVGFDDERDAIAVTCLPFRRAEQAAAATRGPLLAGVPWIPALRWVALIVLLLLGYLYVARPVMRSVVAPPPVPETEEAPAPVALLGSRSPEFQRQLVQLTGHEGEGDPLASALQTNLPVTVRALRDWIEEG